MKRRPVPSLRPVLFAQPLAALATACATTQPSAWLHPTQQQWGEARAVWQGLMAAQSHAPYVAAVATTMRDARSGRTVDGRGAIAIAPGEAVRMILVGGAGATVLDAWVTRKRWRIAVPPLDVVKRGGAEDPDGLPVGFLRWWFVTPHDGVLFAASLGPSGDRWLLRDREAVIDFGIAFRQGRRRVTATRRSPGHAERIEEVGNGPSPLAAAVGDHVTYVDETTGLRVTVAVESIATAPPDPAAFENPDHDGGGT
ncbi:MAG TPA: hypothetical protein VEK07_09040 [Polyangiaceae bacterium]|nr:hypothetical protein [Polyangiaceae bacterium]